ncbi:MAG TPA: hypothetical protein VGK03_01210 [Geothrix sp.]|jgi:hypothetical protein
MLDNILPRHIDNTFRGQKPALWFFGAMVFMKTTQSLAVLFGGPSVISSADGIPLDTYVPAAAQTVVSLWALLGLTRFWICLLCVLVLVRYRSMVPFMFALLLLHDLGRSLVLHFLPIIRTGTPPGPLVNQAILVMTMVGLVLSLWTKRNPPLQSA